MSDSQNKWVYREGGGMALIRSATAEECCSVAGHKLPAGPQR